MLYTCAFCGPDSDDESNKVTSRFLDMARIAEDSEYENEGIMICIKWYIDIINETKVKKEGETAKKLKAIQEDFEKLIKDQNLAKAQAMQV